MLSRPHTQLDKNPYICAILTQAEYSNKYFKNLYKPAVCAQRSYTVRWHDDDKGAIACTEKMVEHGQGSYFFWGFIEL